MSTCVRDVCATLEEWAPTGLAYPWDHVGLAVGTPDAPVRGVLAALSLTPEVLETARRERVQLVVLHHPPIWEPLERLRTDVPETRILLAMARYGMACYAAHTNLDVVPGGVNEVFAERLGLKGRRPLLPLPHAGLVKIVTFVPESHLAAVREAVCGRGAGIIGAYTHCSFSVAGVGTFLPGAEAAPFSGLKGAVNEEPERRFEVVVPESRLDAVVAALKHAHPYEEVAFDVVSLKNADRSIGLGLLGALERPLSRRAFYALVRKAAGVAHVRAIEASEGAVRIQTVAVLAGSGGGEIENLPRDIDAYVTGDVRYHDALKARLRGITVVDPGHAAMEKWIVPVIAQRIRQRHPALRVRTCSEPEWFRTMSEGARALRR